MSPRVTLPHYSADGAWIWTGRFYGWLPVPGTYPLPPRGDRPLSTVASLEHNAKTGTATERTPA